MAKTPRRTGSKTKHAAGGKKPVAQFTGTANAPVKVEVVITDATYEVDILADDIDKKRVWFETPADDDGWFRLVYSADGPTGDPWPIGKIRFVFDADALDNHFANTSGLTLKKTDASK